MFPLTESDLDSDILSDPIIMETINICRNWQTGSNSDIRSDFLESERIPVSESNSVSMNSRLKEWRMGLGIFVCIVYVHVNTTYFSRSFEFYSNHRFREAFDLKYLQLLRL